MRLKPQRKYWEGGLCGLGSLKHRVVSFVGHWPLVRKWVEFRYRSSLVTKATRTLPSELAIELTNICNLRCAKCPINLVKRKRGFLDKNLFAKILGDVERAGSLVSIALSGGGEPTLHKDVVEFVKIARSIPNVRVVGFASNAVQLTPEMARRLLDAGLNRLKISLDTNDPEVYRKMNGRDVYDVVEANISSFCSIKKSGGYECDVEMKFTLYGTDGIAVARALKERWLGHVDRFRVTTLHNWTGLTGKRKGRIRTKACPLLWHQIQVLWDGQITLCCLDSMEGHFNMGNAWEVDLSKYWQHAPDLLRIRKAHLNGDFSELSVCANCDVDQYHAVDLD